MKPLILILEDDSALRTGIAMLLGMQGHTNVVAVATLAEARESLDIAVPSHAILDFDLPDGTGIDLLRYMRAAGMGTGVMMITGTLDATVAHEAKQLGVEDFLVKPPNWDLLTDWIATQ